MLKKRLIPVLLYRGGRMVKGVQFLNYRDTGDPVYAARVYNSQYVDELIFLDIDASVEERDTNKELISEISKECFMPLTVGGGVNSISTIRDLLRLGADKVIINTAAYEDENLIRDAAELFGRQCIVVGIDVRFLKTGYQIYKKSGTVKCKVSLEEHAMKVQELGAGELFINSITNDGKMSGYDINLIKYFIFV